MNENFWICVLISISAAIILVLWALIITALIVGYKIFKSVCMRRTERPNTFDALFSTKHTSSMAKEDIFKAYTWFDDLDTENFSIMSHDGLRLWATAVYAHKDIKAKGVVLLFHGYNSAGRRDFCLQLKMLHDAGYHILLADQRAHGRSEGKYRCYGIKERFDVLSWYEKSRQLFDKSLPVALMGLSMGGATVLMASELLENNIKCVVADCPFNSPWAAVSHVMQTRHKIPYFPLLYFANFWCMLLAKINLRKHSANAAVMKTKLPYLLLHGAADDYVTISHSKQISHIAGERATLCIYENARHAECAFCEPERYQSELLSFLDKHMR